MSETLPAPATSAQVAKVRAFNRFYTRVIGVLQAGLVGSRYSLVEARVLYELAQRQPGWDTDGAQLRRALELDTGYFSRVLAKLETAGLIRREQSSTDGRRQLIQLSEVGRQAFAELDQRQVGAVDQLLAPLSGFERHRVIRSMRTIHRTLDRPTGTAEVTPEVTLREPRPGDLGWVVARNGALYAREYGWTAEYEALVARIVADYAGRDHGGREAGWIAEVAGRRVGAVFCMADNEHTARLRLLLVEPSARGLGVGGRLVEQCLSFARAAGYRHITLWTVSLLAPARRIYQRAGFTLDNEAPLCAYGQQLTQQNWSRAL
ncbi:MAG TPA: bifunctional helix-turn-helix transcriptional regulator/GNAT family N-acetyltransferase [Pseudonocardia sp.]|jgi:DNA-binding MarR family transcriptional regulator/GNAT superfamily N-acetyltransferase